MLLLIVIVHLSYFRRKALFSGGWENNKGLTPFTALFLYCCSAFWLLFQCIFILFIHHKAPSWPISEASKSILYYVDFALLLLLLLSIMSIDSRTWYARIGVFQSTKIVTQSNSFQKDNLKFTVQNIAFMQNKMSIKFFLILFFLMWVLLKINFDISQSVIAKCIKGPLMSIHSACENIFTKQLIDLLLILPGDIEQNPDPEKEKSHITFCH